MFTTRREGNEGYAREATAGGGVGLLERAPVAENTAAYGEARTESVDEAKLRMQRNLDKLLHYDEADYSAAEVSVPETEKAEQVTEVYDVQTALAYAAQVKAQQKLAEKQQAEEEAMQSQVYAEAPAPVIEQVPYETEESDIRPTSTTMQFGEGESDNVYNDLTKTRETTKNSYKLNAKGKIVVALYAVAVMVILALIVLNTGVLASLKSGNSALVENITELSGQYEELVDRIETVSSDDYVKDIAENVYNMIKR